MPECFNRNLKPRIKLQYYPKLKRSFWIVERDMSIPWRELTRQEQSNILAAYEFVEVKLRNR